MSKPATLREKDIRHIARLAFLTLSPQEIVQLSKQLTETLTVVAKLKELDTKSVSPTAHITGLENVMRSDEINQEQTLPRNDVMKNAKNTHNKMFKTGAIFNEAE